jgi:predicted permease
LTVAGVLTRAVLSILPAFPFPLELSLPIDGRAMLFTTALTLVAAIVSGLVPAAQASRVDLDAAINAERHGARRMRLRRAFVVAQVALSIILVVVGGLFVRAMFHAGAADPGFDARGVELVSVKLGNGETSTVTADALALDAIVARVNAIPGIARVSAAWSFPGGFEEMRLGALRVRASGRQADDGEWNVVTPGYFDTIRMPLRAGRDFAATDRAGAPRVAIVGEGTARRLWPGRAPAKAVGEVVEHIGFNAETRSPEVTPITIVGVTGDPAYGTLIDGRNDVHVYVPMTQMPRPTIMLVVRTTDGRSAANEVRAAVAVAAPAATVNSIRSAEEYSMLGLLPQRVGASVTATLGLVGLLLAAIGVYGVTASAVARRRREIGIRIALGAPAAAITRMILGEGLSLVVIGALTGLPLAVGAGQLVAGHLAGLPPTDSVTFWGAAASFTLMGLLACSAPLARALRISPTETLRDT